MVGLSVLLVSLEFDLGTFSGNGVYASSLVRGLASQGCTVVVACGAPRETDSADVAGAADAADVAGAAPAAGGGSVSRLVVRLDAWGTLDKTAAWEAFGASAAKIICEFYAGKALPDVVLGVDWTSLLAYKKAFPAPEAPPLVWLNFRVFARQDGWYEARERDALKAAALTLALSESDADYLRSLGGADVRVLLPPLRADVAARAAAMVPAARKWLTCCVRLSPEKEPERFVKLVEALAASGALTRLGLVPYMVAAQTDAYASSLVARLRRASPEAVIAPFLTADDLARLYSETVLNVHPPLYDAFGMSVVEAAAFGALTLLNAPSDVGAKVVLRGAFLQCAFEGDQGACNIERFLAEALADGPATRKRAADATAHALAWTEEAHGARLVELLRPALLRRPGAEL
mmetsp:Transcript_13301/g.47230  ORF Transcript_13301/g.47230 Transcript_13301/m.47230 type:complete len:405 (+) Transcript_13301:128-1342(+)